MLLVCFLLVVCGDGNGMILFFGAIIVNCSL